MNSDDILLKTQQANLILNKELVKVKSLLRKKHNNEKKVSELSNLINAKDVHIANLESIINNFKDKLAEKDVHIRNIEAEKDKIIFDAQNKKKQFCETVNSKDNIIKMYENQLTDIKNSRSFKLATIFAQSFTAVKKAFRGK